MADCIAYYRVAAPPRAALRSRTPLGRDDPALAEPRMEEGETLGGKRDRDRLRFANLERLKEGKHGRRGHGGVSRVHPRQEGITEGL